MNDWIGGLLLFMATLLLCYLCLPSAATAILSWSHHTTRPFVPLTRLNSCWLLTSADTLTLGLRWARLLLQKHQSVAEQRQYAVRHCLFVVFHSGVFLPPGGTAASPELPRVGSDKMRQTRNGGCQCWREPRSIASAPCDITKCLFTDPCTSWRQGPWKGRVNLNVNVVSFE